MNRPASCIGCSFKCILKVGVEESVVNVPRITDHGSADRRYMDRLYKSNLTFCVVCVLLCKRTSGAFTMDSSTPTLRINLNEHPILFQFEDVN
jgi:hypothetical protein